MNYNDVNPSYSCHSALSAAQQTGLPRVSFAEPVPNVTVAVGRDAALSCVVDNLGSHRVSFDQHHNLIHIRSL